MEAVNTETKFLVIDDDAINNYVCSRLLRAAFPGSQVETYTMPEEGLDAMSLVANTAQAAQVVLLLDINIPLLSGWDVLDRFAGFPEEIKKRFTIYILSSSISLEDKSKADANALLSGFWEKPLSVEMLDGLKGNAL